MNFTTKTGSPAQLRARSPPIRKPLRQYGRAQPPLSAPRDIDGEYLGRHDERASSVAITHVLGAAKPCGAVGVRGLAPSASQLKGDGTAEFMRAQSPGQYESFTIRHYRRRGRYWRLWEEIFNASLLYWLVTAGNDRQIQHLRGLKNGFEYLVLDADVCCSLRMHE